MKNLLIMTRLSLAHCNKRTKLTKESN